MSVCGNAAFRCRADAMAVPLRRLVNSVDPNLPLYFVGTPKVQIDGFVTSAQIVGFVCTHTTGFVTRGVQINGLVTIVVTAIT